jgi:hypothetical protein
MEGKGQAAAVVRTDLSSNVPMKRYGNVRFWSAGESMVVILTDVGVK